MHKQIVLNKDEISRTLKRMAHEILERNKSTDYLVLVGIKTRGEYLANRLQDKIEEIEGVKVPTEILDITFYRDDLTHLDGLTDPTVKASDFKHNLTDKRVVIVDDVLYTGRTVRAAMDAILAKERPSHIQLAILIDRGHRELPIRADFVGKNIPTSRDERVSVELVESDQKDQVCLLTR